jgi:hypothetical protein
MMCFTELIERYRMLFWSCMMPGDACLEAARNVARLNWHPFK